MSQHQRQSETTPLLQGSSETYVDDNDRISVSTASTSPSLVDPQEIVARRLNGARLFAVLCGLWTGVFLASLDSSIVATIYPQIGTEFKKSNEIVWIATSYMLSYTALQPLFGRISDAFGRKSALLFAVVVFFIGSLFCGAATDMWSLVIARGIAGIGGGGLNTMSAVITSDLVSLRERGKYQGYANISYALGSVIGAPLGGLITDGFGWRYCFYINLPILCISLYVASFLLTDYNLKEQAGSSTTWERFKKIDYLGATMVVIGVVTFMFATSLGGNSRPWSDSLVVGCLVTSLLAAIAFCVVEVKVAVSPLMPWHIVTSRTPFTCSLANFFGILCSYGMTYTTPLFFQGLLGYSPAQAGLFYLPKIAALSIGSLAAGYWISYSGEYRRFLIISSGLSLMSMTLYSLWVPETTFFIIIPTLMLDGFSSGAIVTAALVAMLSCVDQQEMATITSMSYLFRSTGGVIGISATSAIFQGVVKSVLTEKITGPDAERIIEIARKSMTEVRELLPPDALRIVLDSYQEGIKGAFLFCVGIAALGLLATLFVKNHDLGGKNAKK